MMLMMCQKQHYIRSLPYPNPHTNTNNTTRLRFIPCSTGFCPSEFW